jgi:hypothetical protein
VSVWCDVRTTQGTTCFGIQLWRDPSRNGERVRNNNPSMMGIDFEIDEKMKAGTAEIFFTAAQGNTFMTFLVFNNFVGRNQLY